MFEKFWWTWTGSNRRPLPCHLRNINDLQTSPLKTRDLPEGTLDAGGRHGAVFTVLDSARTPGLPSETALRVPSRARLPAVVIVVCWRRQQFHFPNKGDPLLNWKRP